jgi:hypothetical protein
LAFPVPCRETILLGLRFQLGRVPGRGLGTPDGRAERRP